MIQIVGLSQLGPHYNYSFLQAVPFHVIRCWKVFRCWMREFSSVPLVIPLWTNYRLLEPCLWLWNLKMSLILSGWWLFQAVPRLNRLCRNMPQILDSLFRLVINRELTCLQLVVQFDYIMDWLQSVVSDELNEGLLTLPWASYKPLDSNSKVWDLRFVFFLLI